MKIPIDPFKKRKAEKLLVVLRGNHKKWCGTLLARETATTYSYAALLLKQLKIMGLVDCFRVGRKDVVTLTKCGEEIADTFIKLRVKLNRLDNQNETRN